MGMTEGEGVLEEGMGQGTEGLDMTILVDMSVMSVVDKVFLMKDPMVVIWAAHLVAIKVVRLIGVLVVLVLLMLLVLGEPKRKE